MTGHCQQCDSSCKTCSGTLPTNCLSCNSGKYLLQSNNTCVSCNVDGYYADTVIGNCMQCDTACKTCSGPLSTNCLSCNSGKYLLQTNNSCVTCDVDGYHADTLTGHCLQCDLSCKTCSGILNTNCITCNSGKYLLQANNSCVSCNVSGYYADIMTGYCEQCDSSCNTCSGILSTNCLSCNSGKYLLQANNSCVTCDVDGYYADTLTGHCLRCDMSCKTCSGALNTNCLSCNSGKYLLQANKTCVSCDVDGYYADTMTGNCIQCDSTCKTCSGAFPTNCLSCNSGKYLLQANNSCVTCDVDGYYPDPVTGYCEQCDASCKACSGGLNTNCVACNSGKYLLQANNSCVTCVANGYYADIISGNCLQCDSRCKTCFGAFPTNCLSCNSGKYLLHANNSCVSCNVNGYFADIMTGHCQQCDSSCKTCSGILPTNCLSCNSGKYLLQLNNTCVSCNVDGYYADTVTGNCMQCDSFCKTCSGPLSTNCLSCSSGTYLMQANNSCISCNADGYYPDTNLMCQECDPTCKTCNGPFANNCKTCYTGYSLDSNQSCTSNAKSAVYDPTVSLSPTTLSVVSKTSSVASNAIHAQSASTTLLPLIGKGASTTAVLLTDFVSDVLIFRFVNVAFPDNFMAFCTMLYTNFLPNIYSSFSKECNISDSSNGKFQQFQMSTVLLDNSGNTLDRELFALVTIGVGSFLSFVLRKVTRLQKILTKIKTLFMWNVFLTFYIGDFAELFLYSMLQLTENTNTSWYAQYCLGVAITILTSYALLVGLFIYFINKPKPETKKAIIQGQNIGYLNVPSSINMITEGLRLDHWFTKNFMLVLMAQNIALDLLLLLAQNYGLIQAAVYAAVSLVMWIITTFIYKPFEGKLQTFLFGMNNFVKVVLALLALFIGINEKIQYASQDGIDKIGIALIALVITAVSINALMAVGVVFLSVVKAIRDRFRKNQVHNLVSINSFGQVIDLDVISPTTMALRTIRANDSSPKVMIRVVSPRNPVNTNTSLSAQNEDFSSQMTTPSLNFIKASSPTANDDSMMSSPKTDLNFFMAVKQSVYKKTRIFPMETPENTRRRPENTDS